MFSISAQHNCKDSSLIMSNKNIKLQYQGITIVLQMNNMIDYFTEMYAYVYILQH